MQRNPQRLLTTISPSQNVNLDEVELPTAAEVRAVIPDRCFDRSLVRSSLYGAMSLALTLVTAAVAYAFIPFSLAWTPAWVAYALVCGTFSTGVWVVAHECGHGAFSDNKKIGDAVGFVFHSALLVPYFSWQRSHAIHHAKTNHLSEGETHVPNAATDPGGIRALRLRAKVGPQAFAALFLAIRLGVGWPLYLVAGASGAPGRGTTNHFWPWAPFSGALFPKRLVPRVLLSTFGVLVAILGLGVWAFAVGSIVPVLAVYVGPYLVGNAWLVTYTWLQHTDEDIPHYATDEWSFVRGAFCSVDRPYGRVFDFLHHNIGSSHVAHHLVSSIPHYHAKEATEAIATAYPSLYRYDATPVLQALWTASKHCVVVEERSDGWWYAIPEPADL